MHAGKVQTHFRHGGGAHSKNRESKHEWGVGFEGKGNLLLRKATASSVVVVQFEQSQIECS